MTNKVKTTIPLDALAASEAWVQLSGDPEGEVTIAGNAAGLTRLGQLLLKCALDTPESREYRSCGSASSELRTLAATGSDLTLVTVDLLDERPEHTQGRKRIPDKLALVGCGILVFAVGFIFLMGLGVVTGIIPIARRP